MDPHAETLAPLQVAVGLGLALAVGAAVGLERERNVQSASKRSFGGARTFPLVALLGALCGVLSRSHGGGLLAVGAAALTVLVGLSYWRAKRADGDDQPGLTTEMAALVVYLLGALPFVPSRDLPFPARVLLVGAVGSCVMALLALRRPIHAFAEQLSREDLLATVRFALAALVVLPLLPNESYGPFEVLNPFRIGVVVVLIAGISFVGYVAVRVFGARTGMAVTAAAGGLVSSTAVTLSFASRAKEHPELRRACALAVCLASTIMFPRVLVLIAALRPSLAAAVALPLGVMFAVAALGALLTWRRQGERVEDGEPTHLSNPFRLREAVRLGLVYAVVRLVSAVAWEHFGQSGLYASAFLSGLADVDAISLSVANMHGSGLDRELAVGAVTVAAATNTLVKVGLSAVLGGRELGRAVALVLAPAAVAGCVAAFAF
ncbi:MAG TPA: MgtC/SapB family protein [Planctomycetota bacterium]|nr:MgtC/SapB family protein [Planctomycetota bacterium]